LISFYIQLTHQIDGLYEKSDDELDDFFDRIAHVAFTCHHTSPHYNVEVHSEGITLYIEGYIVAPSRKTAYEMFKNYIEHWGQIKVQ